MKGRTWWQNNPVIHMYSFLWTFSYEKRWRIILFTCMSVIANLFVFLSPLLIAKILNLVQESGLTEDTIGRLLFLSSLFIVIEIGFWSFHGPARVLESSLSTYASANFKQYLVDGVMDLPVKWHTDNHSGDTIDKIEKASMALKEFGFRTFEITQAIVRLLSSYIALIYFNVASSYLVLFSILVTFTLILQFDKHLIVRFKKLNIFQNEASAKVYDIISNITTVVILRIEKLVSKTIAHKLYKPLSYDHTTNKINEIKWFLVALCVAGMHFLVLSSYLLSNFRTGEIILVGTLSALINYVGRIGTIFYTFAYRYGDIVKWRTTIENVNPITEEFSRKKQSQQIPLTRLHWKKLAFEHMSFSYEDKEKGTLHLDDVSLHLHRKERIAFIGASGSGKTTALKLIRELYPAREVTVTLDNKPLEGIGQISQSISLIPQDPELFSTTIRENITLGLPIPEKKIRTYLRLARFEETVKRLPNGLSSSIVEKGVNLSGGEKQRLALARGLMFSEHKEIILLDEPTSSVDAKNELDIYTSVFSHFKDKTIISSIHRLHLLPLFDTIYFFKRGKLVISGTYNDLKKNSKEFSQLLKKYEELEKKK